MIHARLTLLGLALALAGRADEGMWTFDNLPGKQMAAKLGFTPDQAWIDHLRLAALRFPGGSGSFVSADGLVLTNHHVGHNWIQAVSSKGADLVENGFVAAGRDQEIKVPGLVLRTLEKMENVTLEIEKAVQPGMKDSDAAKARDAALRAIVEARTASWGLEAQPVSLYQGGESWVYGYRKHEDVRLVMAPEYGVAAFGKEHDNFSWPRHDFDIALFRVYQDGKPYKPPHFLKWTSTGVKYGEATFVVGHPGRTSRLETLAQMRYNRDHALPLAIRGLDRRRKALHAFAAQGAENARQVSAQIMSVENSFKVYTHSLAGLKNAEAMAVVETAESELRAKVARNPALSALAGGSWSKIEQALERLKEIAKDLGFVNSRNSQLLATALDLVRLTEEETKSAGQRQGEHRDPGASAKVKSRLESGRPVNPADETKVLAQGLKESLDELGAPHPFVQAALAGRSPEEAAKALVEGSRLADPEFRKALLAGGAKAVSESQDPMVKLARRIEPLLRDLRTRQAEAQAAISENSARIARARFGAYGKETYPDGTGTLRFSYGALETYPLSGTLAQPLTTFGGLFDRADAWGPEAEGGSWELPKRWLQRRTALNMSTPFNFITSNDIIGGNSGSPVVNRKGEVVGVAFDGNIESNAGSYYYDPRLNRMLTVDARGIVEALAKVYDAPHLVKELTGR
jgi:hypothetical protein